MSEIIKGAEKVIVFLNTHKPSAIDQATVNIIGAFTTKKDVEEQLITSIKDVKGLETTELLYAKIRDCFAAGAKQILIFGKNQTAGSEDYADLFNSPLNEWFGTITDETEIEKITLMSKELAARQKMLFWTPPKETEVNAALTGKMSGIAAQGTAIIISRNQDEADAIVAGYAIPQNPGAVLIANKVMNGGIDGGLSGAEQATIKKAKGSYFARAKGQIILAEGRTVTGDPIDFIHCLYALKFRLEEDMTAYLINTPKPSFDDLSPLKTTILKRTTQFEDSGALIAGKTVITFPALEEIPDNDILNGVLTGVKIEVKYRYGTTEINGDIYFAV